MRTSIGLLIEQPTCRHHGPRYMKRQKLPMPFATFITTNKNSACMRTIWRCKVKGCATVWAGNSGYQPLYSHTRRRMHLEDDGCLSATNPWA